MKTDLMLEESITINTCTEKVWEALTDPKKIKHYLFNADTFTDWEIGSPIIFTGSFNDFKFYSKGEVLEFRPGAILKYTYFNSPEGYADIPDNYTVITYTITKINEESVKLTHKREHIPSEKEKKNSRQFLLEMLKQLKAIAEKN